MGVKFLKINVERFAAGKLLAKPIYLNMPFNRKMICVASKGDYLRPNLLNRLPPFGVGSLYAYAPDGENRNPDTYPIHLDELMREEAERSARGLPGEAGAEELVRKIRGAANPEEGLAFQEVAERSYGDSQIFVKDSGISEGDGNIIDLRPPEQQENLGSILREDLTTEEVTQTRIIASVTESIQDECTNVQAYIEDAEQETRISAATDVIDDGSVIISGQEPAQEIEQHTISGATDVIDQGELRVKHLDSAERPERKLTLHQGGASAAAAEEIDLSSSLRKELRHAESLGSVLVGVVKQLARAGDRYQSNEIKFLAGTMGETARVFFNSSMQRESDSVSKALEQMQGVWQELSRLSQGENKARYESLNLALEDAICLFRRESKSPDPAAAAVAVAQAA